MDLVRFVLAVVPALGVVLGAAVSGAPPAGRIPRIGYLPSAGTSGGAQPTLQAVRQGLAERGYVDGRDIIIEARWAEGRVERLPELAAELVGLNVDIIVTLGGVATRAAKNATSTVPIVFAVVIDPVAGGLVPDRQRPAGNLTGFTSFDPQEMRPHLEVLQEVIPGLARVAFLGDAGVPGSPKASKAWDEQQARTVGLHAHTLRVRGPSPDLEGALEAARQAQAQAVLVLEMPVTIEHRRRIAELAIRHRLPTLFVGSYGDGGGLISLGTSRGETGRQLATYVDKILKGAQPGALPVERLTHHELIVNLEAARSIGVTIPLRYSSERTESFNEMHPCCRTFVFSRRRCAPRLIQALATRGIGGMRVLHIPLTVVLALAVCTAALAARAAPQTPKVVRVGVFAGGGPAFQAWA